MLLRKFFGFTKAKRKAIIISAIFLNVIPSPLGIQCIDGIDFGYCIKYHGLPFPSFIITGEIGNMPINHLLLRVGVIGFIGFLINSLIAYLLISSIFFVYYKLKK